MSGPWIQTAVLCESVAAVEGKLVVSDVLDGMLIEAGSLVRLHLVITLVRGDWQGPIKLHVAAYEPGGDPVSALDIDGDPPAIPYAISRIVVPVELEPGAPGVYWFDLSIENQTLTRVPLRVDWR